MEVWVSDAPVTRCDYHGVDGATDGNVLFGSVTLEQHPGETLHALAKQAYTSIFEFIDHHDCRNLLRVWHYFPQINDDENGLERYRSFNAGRHEGFVANGRSISEESVPAASALGSNSGSLVVYFMAGKQPGTAVDNPRQVSAYRYPHLFGPRSPIFVRAMSATVGGQHCFFISGTAALSGTNSTSGGCRETNDRDAAQYSHAVTTSTALRSCTGTHAAQGLSAPCRRHGDGASQGTRPIWCSVQRGLSPFQYLPIRFIAGN